SGSPDAAPFSGTLPRTSAGEALPMAASALLLMGSGVRGFLRRRGV
ncbi:MAG: hypothetical protein HYU28_06865, partial [Actinobacteria bacterium]|nr:hypothetical protein [Actinomycetota bacterium]